MDDTQNGNNDLPSTPDEMLAEVQTSLADLWTDFLARTPFLFAGIGVLIATWVIAYVARKITNRLVSSNHINRGLRDLLKQLVSVAIWIAGLTVAAVVVFPGMTPAKVIAGLGIGSVALGFAFKDIVENFLAGVLILWRFPFNPGDYIACGDIEGEVKEVTIRMTLVRQPNGELVVLPNAKLFKEPVIVRTAERLRRSSIISGVAYDTDVEKARKLISDAVSECELVDATIDVEVFAQEFASSSINFEVAWWCDPTPLGERRSRDEVIQAIKAKLDSAGIEIPFPYRTLTFKDALPIDQKS